MTENEIIRRVDSVKNYVILSNTRISYLLQLFELIKEKNRILMVNEPFFVMVIRDMNRSLILDLRALIEDRKDTHNIQTMLDVIDNWAKPFDNYTEFQNIAKKLLAETKNPLTKKVLILAGSQAAHRSIKLPNKTETFTYKEASSWLESVGNLLNEISGLFWRLGTAMRISGSEDDGFTKEFQHIERAELAGAHLLRVDPNHKAVRYADRIIGKKKK